MPEQSNTTDPQGLNQQQPAKQVEEHQIPKWRLDEVLEKNRQLSDALAAAEAERKAEIEKRLAEQNQWKELAEKRGAELTEAQQKASQVAEYEKTLTELLEKEIAELPQDKRGLVPAYGTTRQRLEWISTNRAIIAAPKPFDIGAGRQGGGETQKLELTPEEIQTAKAFGMTPEEYAKYK